MSTKLAIELLTQSHNNLTSFLSGLGLLGNQTAITQLKTKFDAAFKSFLDDYDGLKRNVAVTSSQVETVGDKLALAKEYHKVEEERLQELLLQKTALVKDIDRLKEQKESIEKFSDSEKKVITDKIEAIKKDIIKTENDLANRRQEISNKQVLISTYQTQINDFRAQETYHNGLAAQYDQESRYWGVVSTGRSGKQNYGWLTDNNKVALRDQEYAKAASADQNADNLAVQINTLQTQINEAKPYISIVEKELIAHVLRLEGQKDILSLNGLNLTQKLATIELQIKQQSDDLGVLNVTTITQQQTIVNTVNTKLLAVQTELNKLQIDKTTADKLLTDFETKNNYLLTDDVTGFLDWKVTANTPETVKLWQQYLGVEGLQIVKERLTSLQSQGLSEEAVKVALTENNIEGYVKLGGTLATEIKGLSDIWLENLQESHNLTVKVYDLSQKRTTDINNLVTYVEANLAKPQGNYVLDKIQLEEAIALQEAQVKYKDALSNSVDSLEEAIAVLQTQVEQYKIVSVKLDHISQLTSLEKQYVTLGSQASQALRLQLVDVLNKEITNKTQDLIVQIDLSNDQQEQWLETNLSQYINHKQQAYKNDFNSPLKLKYAYIWIGNPEASPPKNLQPIDLTPVLEKEYIDQLQNLRVETAYLTLQAEQNPNKLQSYLTEYQIIQGGNFSILPNVSFNFIDQAQGLKTGYWADENNSEQLIGDFNGDGKDDIVNLQSDGISNNWVALSNGNGTFKLKGAYSLTNSNNSYQTGLIAGFWGHENNSEQLIGDFNGDGKDDIVNLQSDGISNNWIALSNGDGTFKLIARAQGLTAGYWGDENNSEQLIGDFNGDGKDDIVNLQSDGTSNNWIALSNGNGTFNFIHRPQGLTAGYWGYENNSEQLIGDFNGDGLDDILNLQSDGTSNNWIALSNGNGTFKFLNHSQGLTAGYWGHENNSEQLIGDFNGDGLDDIVNLQSDGISNNWVALTNNRKAEAENILRTQYYPALNDATTLAKLKEQITDELTNSQTQLETLKGQISQKQAASVASLSQADWYEEQAQINWELSHKQGPTWTEWRSYKKKKWTGSVKTVWVPVTHVDHNWIIWDAYTKQATSLRQYAANLDKEISSDSYQKDLTASIISQWQQANATADDASLTLDQFIAQLKQLEAQSKLLPEQQAQLATFQTLLPVLKQQLETAQKAAEQAKANTIKEQTEYDTSSQAYQTALNDILAKKTALDTNTQNLLQQIANTRAWVEQQTLSLDTEITETIALEKQLKTQLDVIARRDGTGDLVANNNPAEAILSTNGIASGSTSVSSQDLQSTTFPRNDNQENLTKIAQIEQSLNLLTHKETFSLPKKQPSRKKSPS